MLSTIKRKLVAGCALLALLGFAILIGFNAYTHYQAAREATLKEARLIAEREAGTMQRSLEEAYYSTRALAQASLALRSQPSAEGRQRLSEVVRAQVAVHPQAVGYFVIWEANAFDGQDSQHTGPTGGRYGVYWYRKEGKTDVIYGTEGVDESPYYTEPKQQGRPVLTEPYVDSDIKILMGTVSFPMVADGRVLGVAGCDVALTALQGMAEKIKPYGLGYMSIYSHGGAALAGLPSAALGKPDPDLPAEAREAIGHSAAYEYASADGFYHFLVPVRVGSTAAAWSVRISIPLETALAPVKQAQWKAVGISVLILGVIVLLLAALTGWLLRPLEALRTAMGELASGEGDLTRRLDIHSGDEIGVVASAFNRFIDALQGMMGEVQQNSQTLNGAAHDLSGEMTRLRSTSAGQSQAAHATASSIEELSVSITHIADAAQRAHGLADEASELAGVVSDEVVATAHEIGRMAETVHGLADTLSGLDNRSEEISRIVGVIHDIADQTNLLALNAAIEAARAGEQGRGFAVVADEVRKLAERTAQATLEIGGMIERIQSETRLTSASMSQTLEQVDGGVRMAEQAAVSIGIIRDRSQAVVATVSDIASATAEQSSASQDIARHIEAIHAMVSQTDHSLGEAQQATEALRRLGDELARLVARFRL